MFYFGHRLPFPQSRETPVLHNVFGSTVKTGRSGRYFMVSYFPLGPFSLPQSRDPQAGQNPQLPHPRAFPILHNLDTAEQNRFPLPFQSPVTSHQSPVTIHHSPVTSHQSPVTSHILLFWTLRHLILDTCFASFKLPIPGSAGRLTGFMDLFDQNKNSRKPVRRPALPGEYHPLFHFLKL